MKKLVYLLICLFLLSAGFAACSSDTDDPPEQPSSHQNETPVDSIAVNNDTTEIDSTETYTVISAVPASEEVKAFFDESLPYYCDSIIIGGGLQIGDFHLDHPEDLWTYNIIRDQESFESNYTGNKPLPHIDFNKYILIYGRHFLGLEEIIDSINIHITNNQSSIVLHTTRISTDIYDISERLKSFWAIFPKDIPEISGVNLDRKNIMIIKPVEASSTVKAFFDEALPFSYDKPAYFKPYVDLGDDNGVHILSQWVVYSVFNSKEEMQEQYIGDADLPDIDFDKYTLIIGTSHMDKMDFLKAVEVRSYDEQNELTLSIELGNYGQIEIYHFRFWAIFPKIQGGINQINYTRSDKDGKEDY